MKRLMEILLAFSIVFSTTACAGNQAARDYYQAVQVAAQERAKADAYRFNALAEMAKSGEPGAATAATMAIALSQNATITPQYVEGSALKWAQVLATPVATLGGLWIQSDVAKNASNNAREIQLASFQSNEAIQLGQQNMVTGLGSQWAGAAAAGGAATVDVALAGFTALNASGAQTVEVAVSGFNTADSIATTGLTTVGTVATAGFTQIGATAEDGMNATANVGLAGMTNLVDLGTSGIDGSVELGKWGMEGIWTTNQDWLQYSTTRDSSIAGIVSDLNATIQQLGTDLATPITCNDDGSGSYTCQ